jgi:uncharacterized SAM-binding protein YcdF (DUF218 family)
LKILFIPAEEILEKDVLSAHTLSRCEKGLKKLQENQYDLLILSGGIFLPPHIQTKPASVLMKEWFVECGFDKNKILVETESVDTFQNIFFTYENILKNLKNYKITVLSEKNHCRRIKLTFKKIYNLQVKTIFADYQLSTKESLMEQIYFLIHMLDKYDKWIGKINQKKRAQA